MLSIYRNILVHPKRKGTFIYWCCVYIYVCLCVGTCIYITTHKYTHTSHTLYWSPTAAKWESWALKKDLRMQYDIWCTIYDYPQVYLRSLFRPEVFIRESQQTYELVCMHHLNTKLWTQGTQFCNTYSGKTLTEVIPLTSIAVSRKYYKV